MLNSYNIVTKGRSFKQALILLETNILCSHPPSKFSQWVRLGFHCYHPCRPQTGQNLIFQFVVFCCSFLQSSRYFLFFFPPPPLPPLIFFFFWWVSP